MQDIYSDRSYGEDKVGFGERLGILVVDFQKAFTGGKQYYSKEPPWIRGDSWWKVVKQVKELLKDPWELKKRRIALLQWYVEEVKFFQNIFNEAIDAKEE